MKPSGGILCKNAPDMDVFSIKMLLILVIIVPANGLALNNVMPSEGSVVAISHDTLFWKYPLEITIFRGINE